MLIKTMLISIGVIVAFNVFAKDAEEKDYATVTELGIEISDRVASDAGLQGQIDTEASDRAAGDAGLQGQINTEASDRVAGDAGLHQEIFTVDKGYRAGDISLWDKLKTETNIRTSHDAAEANARRANDANLQSQIDVAGLPAIPVGGFETESVLKLCAGSTTPQWEPCLELYAIGDVGPAGGIVFHITDGGLHGLEAAPEDQAAAEWGCRWAVLPGADGTAIGTGAQNTTDILARCLQENIAAQIADDYVLNGYDDWFLPSKDELNLIYENMYLTGLSDFSGTHYWSSTEIDTYLVYIGEYAWFQYFPNGAQFVLERIEYRSVRSVRAF
jgi:hypothetical protein